MDEVGTAVGTMVTEFGAASGAIIAAGLTVTAIIWGAPKLVSLFKRTAK
jgi:hypothetical protein